MSEKTERQRQEEALDQLRQQLADAWWHEAPLEQIEELERQITAQAHRLSRM